MEINKQQRRSQSYLSTAEATVLLQATGTTKHEFTSTSSSAADADAAAENTTCRCNKSEERRLLSRAEVQAILDLSEEQVQYLINTRQITAIRIAGEERFDSRDIDRLIDGYKATASRRPL